MSELKLEEMEGKTVAVFLIPDSEDESSEWYRIMGRFQVRKGDLCIIDADDGRSFFIPPDLYDLIGRSDEEDREAAQGAELLMFVEEHLLPEMQMKRRGLKVL